MSTPLAFPGCWLLGYIFNSMLFLEVLKPLASLPSSLNFSEPSYPYFIYDVQGFKLYLEGRTEKITYTPIFQKLEILRGFFFFF